jgi:hypothetical protein
MEQSGRGVLFAIGLLNAVKFEHFNLDWPSITLLLSGASLCFTSVSHLFGRIEKIKYKELEVVLTALPRNERARLSDLSPDNVWALDSFAAGSIPLAVDKLKPAQRFAAYTLVNFELLSVSGEGPNQKVEVTPLGDKVLAIAKALPLTSG